MYFHNFRMTADPENPLVMDILHGTSSSYSHIPSDDIVDYPHAVGIQFRDSSLFCMNFNTVKPFIFVTLNFLDKTMVTKIKLLNMLKNIMEKGVLRVTGVSHHIVGQKTPPAAYTIEDHVEYSILIEQLVAGQWRPFDSNDVQLEFVCIDPFVHTSLKSKNGRFSTKFKLPDVYGVFQFKVNYNRIGFTHLYSTTLTKMSYRNPTGSYRILKVF
ncbi:dolichyl-diphosphooligosaccharide--protein glycosyltransferase 48 kDa subunit-like isoform X1 [Anneissia japonica]|uniref:dolichyl-diphosphooligosaccharide--protein glycosyltransferase 48 kDa subunit-like isoform X1 n=1 Tax=Anneissia japonica TaxID=1529436 RepID=UPI0014255DCA|nr:dolichyl-diphosphooligosaccharide--protein glycosyltransferase 48 kDa subunit-like isoform X1 [Anneissia japonica]